MATMSEELYRLAERFKALGNGVRLQILKKMLGDRVSVTELSEHLDRPQSTVSRHLRRLRDRDLVSGETEGRRRYYTVKRPDFVQRCLQLESLLRREDDS